MEEVKQVENRPSILRSIFAYYVGVLLIGYAFLGKGFAYFGFPPIFAAEIGLALGLLAALVLLSRRELGDLRLLLRPEVLALLAFAIWQAFRTFPYLRQYGLDALRDGALWGYAGYALLIYLVLGKQWAERAIRAYGWVIPLFLAWLPIGFFLTYVKPIVPCLPQSPVPLVWLKAGDVGVHLAGVGAFMLVAPREEYQGLGRWRQWVAWLVWSIGWILFGSISRAGLMAGLFGLLVTVLRRPRTRWYRPLTTTCLMLGLLFATNLRVGVTTGREVSFGQIVANITSVVGWDTSTTSDYPSPIPGVEIDQPNDLRSSPCSSAWTPVADPRTNELPQGPALEGTVRWRLMWWQTIIDYTIRGEHFWLGKGYGINLADDDGFQVTSDHSLRSPHNVFMTILARSGVPGVVLWLVFLGTIFRRLIWGRQLGQNDTEKRHTGYRVWLLAYMAAFILNASFDVFLEGPMGGIWFWSLIGVILVGSVRRNPEAGQDSTD